MKTDMAYIGQQNPVRSKQSVSSPPASPNLYKLAGQWEGFLFRERRWKTYERYGRALSRFLEAFPGRRDVNSFVRPEIIDWVNARLAEGASVATIRIELAAIRSFFQFCVDMQVAMINPARGVKVPKAAKSPSVDTWVSVQPKIDFDVNLHGNRLAVVFRGFKFPSANRLNCIFVQSHP